MPTVDIHMNQIGIHDEWLYIVKTYAAPMVNRFYVGYNPESKPNLMFVVRYKPGEQDRLRPHHDSSTWTFQIALNKPNVRTKVIFLTRQFRSPNTMRRSLCQYRYGEKTPLMPFHYKSKLSGKTLDPNFSLIFLVSFLSALSKIKVP